MVKRVKLAGSGWKNVRDLLTWLLGASGFVYAISRAEPNATAVFATLAALGLPFVFRAEDKG